MGDQKKLPPIETRWKPGQSGNPGGWSRIHRDLVANLRKKWGPHSDEVMARLLEISNQDKDLRAAVQACVAFLDRVAGKCIQPKPEDVEERENDLSKLSDEELAAKADALRAEIRKPS